MAARKHSAKTKAKISAAMRKHWKKMHKGGYSNPASKAKRRKNRDNYYKSLEASDKPTQMWHE